MQVKIFSEILGKEFEGDKFEIIKRHVEILRKYYEEDWLTLYMRKHFLWYTSDTPKASKYRLQIATSKSIYESLEILKEIFSN